MKYKRLKELRRGNSLTQEEMAKVIGCSQECYSRYELGTRDIPTAVLLQLADFHGTSTDYILGRTDKRRLKK